VRNIYSKFGSCNCKWSEQGNTCKHQIWALIHVGQEFGEIFQQLGTLAGSIHAGLHPVEHNSEASVDLDGNLSVDSKNPPANTQNTNDYESLYVNEEHDIIDITKTEDMLCTKSVGREFSPDDKQFDELVKQFKIVAKDKPTLYKKVVDSLACTLDDVNRQEQFARPSKTRKRKPAVAGVHCSQQKRQRVFKATSEDNRQTRDTSSFQVILEISLIFVF
jgi:hypothetical protein